MFTQWRWIGRVAVAGAVLVGAVLGSRIASAAGPSVFDEKTPATQPTAPVAQPAAAPRAIKLTPPDVATQAKTAKVIAEIYDKQYADKSLAGQRALAHTLLEEAEKVERNFTAKFVLLREALAHATAGVDIETCRKAIADLDLSYVADTDEMTIDTMLTLQNVAGDEVLAAWGLDAAQRMIGTENYAGAGRIARIIYPKISKLADPAFREGLKGLEGALAEAEKARPAMEKLKTDPADPMANLTAGRFHCFIRHDYAKGLVLLAKGNDPALKELARQDLASPTDARGQLLIGNGWWELGQDAAHAPFQSALHERARYWYALALPGTAGLDRLLVQKRLSHESAGGPAAVPPPEVAAPLPDSNAPVRVKLPGVVEAVCPADGGKYLILHIKSVQQLAIFDVVQQKVIKYLPVPSNDIVFSAGAQKLFIGIKDLKVIQRWDLAKLKLEATAPAPEKGIVAIAIGCNSLGPVFLAGDKRFWILDAFSFQIRHCPSNHWGGDGSAWGPVHLHVSFDGTAMVANGGGWAGVELATMTNGRLNTSDGGSGIVHEALISGNGSLIFRDKDIMRSDLNSHVTGIEGECFPALDAGLSLAFNKPRPRGGAATLTLFANSNPHPLLTFPDYPELHDDTKVPPWQRIHLIPWAKLLIIINGGGDELIIRKFDVTEELAKTGNDLLFVESSPVAAAQRGTIWTYEMKIRSKSGGVKVELQAAPPGMKADALGRLQWTVPRNFRDPTATVILKVSDGSGQTVFHSFVLTIGELRTGK